MTPTQLQLEGLSDDQLLDEIKRLARCERAATADLLRCLIEVDTRRLYLREGCASLFAYCTQVLHFAEGAAYNRIEAARAARRFPILLERIADGSLTLTSARLLAPHLTVDNHERLLEAARYKGKREVWRRDEGRCAFIGGTRRCTETAVLEFHHVVPYADGGSAAVRNIELRCRAHNQYEAALLFGNDVVREERVAW